MAEKPEHKDDEQAPFEGAPTLLPGPESESARKQAAREEQEEEYRRRDDEFKERQVNIADGQYKISQSQLKENSHLNRLTRGLLIVSLIASGVSICQTWITRQSVQISKNSADAAYLAAMAAVNQVRLAQQANELSEISSASAARQSRAALQASIDAARTDQRAWLTIGTIKIDPPQDGSKLRISASIINKGRTVALDVKYPGIIAVQPPSNIAGFGLKEIKELMSLKGVQEIRSPTVLFPDTPREIEFKIQQPLASGWAALINAFTLRVYVFGDINYKDVAGRQHFTRFCDIYSPGGNGNSVFQECGMYNAAD